MSQPIKVEVDESIRRADTETPRGTFATWMCSPADSSLPHANAILIPGFTGSKEDFGEVLPLLASAGWQAATYDQRGQYESAAAANDDFSLDGYAADLVAVTEALFGTAEQTHVVGHSFGGLVASTAVVTNPDPWASLTLLCSGPGGFDGAKRQDILDGAALVERDGLEAAYRYKQREDRRRGREAPPPEIEKFLHQRFMANSPHSLTAIAMLLADSADLTPELGGAGVPVSVMRGEHDDAWEHSVQDRLAEELGTTVVVIDKAAHSPAVERPEETRDALVRFWMTTR